MTFPLESPALATSRLNPDAGMTWRRAVFACLCVASWGGLIVLFTLALAPDGLAGTDIALVATFALYMLWPLIGFANALIGLVLMRCVDDPVGLVCPPARHDQPAAPITAKIVVALCIRNEDPARVFHNIGLLLADLAQTPFAPQFRLAILSDTDSAAIARIEESEAVRLKVAAPGEIAVSYRRRHDNAGFKAGNIRDFCEHHAGDDDFMLVLDADSRMSAARILSMARIMEATPRLGILQSLAVGLPSRAPLARMFQFGMRLGMRSYTLGSAWWQGDCGPYWGHNALIRIAAFRDHCELPRLRSRSSGDAAILSHDQIEAVLMRRAGYEVRVLPAEGGSFEENPPELIEHMRRDARWCRGNLQYLRLLGMPGLRRISRVQLVLALLMFLASPAYLVFWSLLLGRALVEDGAGWIDGGLASLVLACAVIVIFAPKLASAADVLLRADQRAAFGGGWRFAAGLLTETLFALLVTPIMAIGHSLTMAGIALGLRPMWGAQRRDVHGVSLRAAAVRFWPQTLAGLLAAVSLAALDPLAPVQAAPVYAGALFAIPFAMLTASPAFGSWMARRGLCAIPEERMPRATAGCTLESLHGA